MKRESKIIELWPKVGSSTGLHLLGEWYGCMGRPALLEEAVHLQRHCLVAARKAGLSVLGQLFHQCEPMGATGTVLLAESHLAIHTWPEKRSVTIGVFVGTDVRNNRVKARALYAYLRDGLLPDKENFLLVDGGGLTDVALLSH